MSMSNLSVIDEFASYESGADYVLFKVSKELFINSKEIRISDSDVKTKSKQLAALIIETFCGTNEPLTLNQLEKMQGKYVCVKRLEDGKVSWGKVYSDRIETPEEVFEFRDYESWRAYAHELRVI